MSWCFTAAKSRPHSRGRGEEEGVLRLPFAGDTVTLRLYFEDGGTVHYAYELNGQETLLGRQFPCRQVHMVRRKACAVCP